MTDERILNRSRGHFTTFVEEQLQWAERLKVNVPWTDFEATHPIIIGILGSDGIGPSIAAESQRVLEHLLREQVGRIRERITPVARFALSDRIAYI